MKPALRFIIAAGLAPIAAVAQERFPKFYLDVDAGASLPSSTRVVGADTIEFHNGVRADIALGLRANSWLSAEFASGVIWNAVDKIGGVPVSSYNGSIDLYQIPIMGNVILRAPRTHGFQPYIGAGLGCVAGMLDFNTPLGKIHDTDYTFGFQAFAGLNYRLSHHLEVGIGYKYLQTHNEGWTDGGVALHTEGIATHSIFAALVWKL